MPAQAELVRTVTQSARLSKDQGLLNKEALSLVRLAHVESVAPGYGGHTSPRLCLGSPPALRSLPAARKACEAARMVRDLCFPQLPLFRAKT